jgi:hypothetical protein
LSGEQEGSQKKPIDPISMLLRLDQGIDPQMKLVSLRTKKKICMHFIPGFHSPENIIHGSAKGYLWWF